MKLTYKELLLQDQRKLRARVLEFLRSENLSLMAMAKMLDVPYTTMYRWLKLEKKITSYKTLYKITYYLDKKDTEPKIVKGQTRIQ